MSSELKYPQLVGKDSQMFTTILFIGYTVSLLQSHSHQEPHQTARVRPYMRISTS
jgi:hypothetical protein